MEVSEESTDCLPSMALRAGDNLYDPTAGAEMANGESITLDTDGGYVAYMYRAADTLWIPVRHSGTFTQETP